MQTYLNTPFSTVKTLHFVGIGGIGMSGLAEMFALLGFSVQGSDIKESANTQHLQSVGIKVFIGHSANNLIGVDALVISSAINMANEEVAKAIELGLPVFKRGKMLSELMRYKWGIAVAGTHGKTTTTSLIAHIMHTAKLDPTAIIGGVVNSWGQNSRFGNSKWLVAESDESDGSFLDLPATISVITNIEAEHMEHYKTYESLLDHFVRFVYNIPFYGFSVLCIDDKGVQDILPKVGLRKIITYGVSPQADYQIKNVRYNKEGSVFDIIYINKNNTEVILKDLELAMHGMHNVLNCAASIAVALNIQINEANLRLALKNFSGVRRRFSKVGVTKNITFIDDYGHHPSEIEAVIKSANEIVQNKGKILAIVQPHRFTRLKDHFDAFSKCVNNAHAVMVLDVYKANETPIEGINSQNLVDSIKKHGHKNVSYIQNPENLSQAINNLNTISPIDMVIFLGAGDISSIAKNTFDAFSKL
jgi:UDP-N-acetylmuramate--alanine ligase